MPFPSSDLKQNLGFRSDPAPFSFPQQDTRERENGDGETWESCSWNNPCVSDISESKEALWAINKM